MPEHYPDELPPSDYRARAFDRARVAKHRVGAAVERAQTASDGTRTWSCVITDSHRYHHIDVHIRGVGAHDAVPVSLVETALEEEAGRYPAGARLTGLVNDSPLLLTVALPG